MSARGTQIADARTKMHTDTSESIHRRGSVLLWVRKNYPVCIFPFRIDAFVYFFAGLVEVHYFRLQASEANFESAFDIVSVSPK